MTRLSSIDALRGITVAAMLLVNNAGNWNHVYRWLEHAEWNGCNPPDFIFPFFLLIVGVSISLAYSTEITAGNDLNPVRMAVIKRGLRIIFLGLLLHLMACGAIEGRAFRLMGVLQRIGLCFTLAGLIHLTWRSARVQWTLIAAILLGYWLLLVKTAGTAPNLNLADRIDTLLLGKLAYEYDPLTHLAHDPEGVLTTLPSLATVLLGIRAGEWLRNEQSASLEIGGFGCIFLGGILAHYLPLNKQLWTSSFVLWTTGVGFLSISVMHYFIDQRGWPAFGRSLGINAITAYAGSWAGVCLLHATHTFQPVYHYLFELPFAATISPEFASFLFSATFTAAVVTAIKIMTVRGYRIVI